MGHRLHPCFTTVTTKGMTVARFFVSVAYFSHVTRRCISSIRRPLLRTQVRRQHHRFGAVVGVTHRPINKEGMSLFVTTVFGGVGPIVFGMAIGGASNAGIITGTFRVKSRQARSTGRRVGQCTKTKNHVRAVGRTFVSGIV